MTTVSWQLKLGVDGIGEVKKATDALNQAKKAAGEVDSVVRDAAGRLRHGGSGRFLSAGEKAGMGIPGIPSDFLAQPAKLGAFAKALQAVGGGVSKVFGAKAGAAATRGIMGLAQGLAKMEPYLPLVKGLALGAGSVFLSVSAAAAYGVKAVVQAQAFKEDSMGALRTLLRSNALADQAFRTAVATADFLGRGRQETVGQFVDLLAKGFDIKKVDEIVKSMADLATVDPKANMDSIVRAIGQIKGTGRLQGDELLQLADAGLETSAVYEQLGKILGKSIPDVQKLISAGKVDADTAIQAILAAINSQAGGGKAGAAAAKKSMGSISGLLKRLENLPGNVLFSLDVAPGMERVRSFLQELVGYFDMNSESGKMLTAVLGDAFNEFVTGLLGEDITGGAGGIKGALDSLIQTIKQLNESGKLREFGETWRNIGQIAGYIVTLVGWLSSLTAASDGAGSSFGILGSILSKAPLFFVTRKVAELVGWLLELAGVDTSSITGFFSELGSIASQSLSSLGAEAIGIGTAIVDGIAAGISSGAGAVLNAITSVAGGAIQWAKQLLGIASPSKVFAEIGAFTAEGFAVGVASNDNAQGALADMAAPPDKPGALRIGGSGRGAPLVGELNIRVDGRGADDEKLARLIAAEVQRTLENLAIQVGAVDTQVA